jgi:hypothetical protein
MYQWLATGGWFSLGTPVSASNKTDRNDVADILLKVALNTITLNHRSRKSRKDMEHNGQKKKEKGTNSDLQKTT